MKGFEPVTLSWSGEDYVVPAESQLMLIATLEDALAGSSGEQAVSMLLRKGGPSFARLSAAYGAALRYAGASVTDDEIYLSIMDDMAKGGGDEVTGKVQNAVLGLLMIIAPPMGRAVAGLTPKKQSPATKG